jgi:hypothetical protein
MILLPKSESRLMRILGKFMPKRFMTHMWTTIGYKVYYPTSVVNPLNESYDDVRTHEFIHIMQYANWGFLFWLSYLLLPVPVLFAWFRWYWEREAYDVQIAKCADWERKVYIDFVVKSLWDSYAWTWPKPLMRRYFYRKYKIS